MADTERQMLDRTFDAPEHPEWRRPTWMRGATSVIALVIVVAFVLSILAVALLG